MCSVCNQNVKNTLRTWIRILQDVMITQDYSTGKHEQNIPIRYMNTQDQLSVKCDEESSPIQNSSVRSALHTKNSLV